MRNTGTVWSTLARIENDQMKPSSEKGLSYESRSRGLVCIGQEHHVRLLWFSLLRPRR